jgi:hypothetical protein
MYSDTGSEDSYKTYNTIGKSGAHDVLILGGAISNNGSSKLFEARPSNDYLQILFQPSQLNLDFDQFWTRNGPVPRRDSPNTPSWGGSFCVAP